MKKNDRVVGVKRDTRSPHTKEKVYYYTTDSDYKRGEVINIKVESGGTPKATVVVGNSIKNRGKASKELKEV